MKPLTFRQALLALTTVTLFTLGQARDAISHLSEGVREDDPIKIDFALREGADINVIGGGGQTPLMHAVLTGKENSVKKLLEKNADVTIGEKDGYTPMHGAGFQGRAEIAKMLIDHGVDKSPMHKDGFTPLHRACWGGEQRHTETVRVLLQAGVSPFEKTAEGKNPIDLVFRNDATKRVLTAWMEAAEAKETGEL